jgi:inorganic triphosphatase YgiF
LTDRPVNAPRSFESEVTLVIKERGIDISRDIAGMKSILEYRLKEGALHQIHDTYFDTKNESLRKKRIALRLREIDDVILLTLKSDPRRVSGATRRREVELPWSLQSLVRVANYLELNRPTFAKSEFSQLKPSNIFETLGLHKLQERLTTRVTRDIIPQDKPRSQPIAELALDEVVFLLPRSKVRLFEIEIEAKATRSLSRVRQVGDALIARYQPALRKWFHGKFLTGLAIQRLLEKGTLQNHMVKGDLSPDAFKLIDSAIRSQGF